MTGTQQFQFIVKKGPNPGHTYPVFADKITIGRDPMSDIIFKDPEVSRRHVQFLRDDEGYIIQDLGSTNGTFLDGEKLTAQEIRLNVGQEIALGGAITLIFEERESDISSGDIGTLNTNHPHENSNLSSGTADHIDPVTGSYFDDIDDYEEEEEEGDIPHIDQLQPLPSLQNKSSLHTRVLQASKKPRSETSSALPENARTFTNQQIIYIVVGTALTTVIVCGGLMLIIFLLAGNPLAN